MRIYNYDPTSGLLLSESTADKDPLDEANWLIPAHATLNEPPEDKPGKTRHFDGALWSYRAIPEPDAPEPDVEPTYADLRRREYPTFADQFDILYHGGYDAWKAAIEAVKAKYPKPE